MTPPLKTRFFQAAYKEVLKPLFFQLDPELVHDRMTNFGHELGRFELSRRLTAALFDFADPRLEQTIAGIKFANPIGLAAGFDKNAALTDILPDVGFGFEEIGSITGRPCAGNPKPRLWRLPASQALVVYYGLKNDGADIISERLKGKPFRIPIGVSAAKTNDKLTADPAAAVADYAHVVEKFRGIGDYLTINISCPNAYGGEPFTDPQLLDGLLAKVDELADLPDGKAGKPVFLKLAVDLTQTQLDELLAVVDKHNITGLVCSNLTKKRTNLRLRDAVIPEKGGISGKAVQELSDEQIKYIYAKTKGKYVIMGVGGVFSAEDAYRKIRLGASLVQLITGMIYEGPQLIGAINRGLVALLERDGFSSISQAIGVDNK
jgi:dihydroorotate dehydrogenase